MIDCPCCGSDKVEYYIKDIERGYNLIKCTSCEVVYADPFKEPTSEFYTNAVDAASTNRHSKIKPFPSYHPANNCPQLKNGQGKTLLDIGCGNGAFISFAERNGFKCYGLDIDQNSIKAAKSRNLQQSVFEHGFVNNLGQLQHFPQKYDVITMFEVFEHLDNPRETIARIRSLLNDGGYFIGSLPNIERFAMWQYNMDYERPPYHMTYWTVSSWKNFIGNHNFTSVFAANNNYYGYISDVLSYRAQKGSRNGALNFISKYFFAATKFMIETPIEKIAKNAAGFFFVNQKSN